MLLLFAGCALLPVIGLALISYVSVERELVKQAEDRLADTSKSLAMGIWERLAILDAELQVISSRLEVQRLADLVAARSVLGEDLSSRFRGIVAESEASQSKVVWGTDVAWPKLSAEENAHLETGRPLVKIVSRKKYGAQILLGRRSESGSGDRLSIWGEVEPSYLWWGAGRENTLPAGNELVVLDPRWGLQVFSTLGPARVLPDETVAEVGSGSHEEITWRAGGTEYMGHYRVVNLRPAFHHPSLTLVVSEPKELVAQPLASFKRAFLAIVPATLLLVTLLSLHQIRSSLIPLEKLREGTRSVAAGDFGVTVAVETEDEFAELAGSFNSMASSLERQFDTLESLNQLQQTVLSAFKIDRMVATVLEQFGRIFPCDKVSVCVFNPDCAGAGLIYHERSSSERPAVAELIELSTGELAAFETHRHHLEVDVSEGAPSFMPSGPRQTVGSVIAFPAFLGDELAAVVAASRGEGPELSNGDFDAARQVTDQVAIGLSNTRLVHELDNLNWGTLSALARAIDVRSSWTMGHTERVTNLAGGLGRAMGLSKEQLDTLHRGGLLHDIGKLGVPPRVLDKPGALNAEELEEVREHVRLGVRIIEPIPALAEVIPIVLQHHEWFNGQGYPVGLAGDEICIEARILTVADCYDALNSDRPYRAALSHDQAMQFIRNGAGEQFDPRVVEVFVERMSGIGEPLRPAAERQDMAPPLMPT